MSSYVYRVSAHEHTRAHTWKHALKHTCTNAYSRASTHTHTFRNALKRKENKLKLELNCITGWSFFSFTQSLKESFFRLFVFIVLSSLSFPTYFLCCLSVSSVPLSVSVKPFVIVSVTLSYPLLSRCLRLSLSVFFCPFPSSFVSFCLCLSPTIFLMRSPLDLASSFSLFVRGSDWSPQSLWRRFIVQ